MANPNLVKTISSIANSLGSKVLNQAQRNETVVKILKELNLDPVQPPKDVDGVYVYTLVEYGAFKSEPILKLFREKEIKNAFWKAYTSNNPLVFFQSVEKFLEWNILGDEIRGARIETRPELEKFGKVFIDVARRSKSPDFQPYPDWNLDEYPEEFKPLIQEKVRSFCGRQFVFDTLAQFINNNTKGYFTLVGEAGMGKSTIAAKYVRDYKYPCYFNIRAEGRNRPEQFLDSIRKQLIKHYQLQDAEKADLPTLLEKVSKTLSSGQRLVIVVDALDEVEQEPGDNLLYLPTALPERVYFLLTRRPYTLERKRLALSPGVPLEELDLRNYAHLSRDDVKEYIHLFLHHDFEYKDALRKWIQERNINDDEFNEKVADKSENNFMYLRYVLPNIARGVYKDLNLKQLPDGLQDYYQQHWVRMGMDDALKEMKVIILFLLVEIGTAIPCEMITKIADGDEYDVQSILDEWVEYLKEQKVEEEICYSIYHTSFLDFLNGKRDLDSKRKLFQDVNQRIVDYWEREIGADNEKC
jgi:hypothetical protein